MSKKQWLFIGGGAGVALFLFILLSSTASGLKNRPKQDEKAWREESIHATYVATQLREADKTHSSLVLSFDLENLTDLDYRLSEGPGTTILSRLRSDGSLSQEETIHLSYPVFLPAKQRARMAVEITRPFAWPARNDPQSDSKLKEFVKQRLATVREFVLYDDASHCEIRLPGAWLDVQETPQALGKSSASKERNAG